ncbi:MAG: LytTR family DNA-binding domain-containing protein [Fulvivirga sp.]|nr:LytTR family DNA-binding domain-containing protein [Fulvivirga sp.]
MLNAIIVEDEKHSRETLKNLITEFCEGVTIMGMAENVEQAIREIESKKPDLVFLDIELQTGTGFDVLKALDYLHFDVIFTTAFEHYAIKAIKFSSIDYLLKPIDIDELQQAIDKARQKKGSEKHKDQLELLLKNLNHSSTKNRICLSTSDGIEFIQVNDIVLCEANGSYTNFYIEPDQKLVVSKNLKEYERLLEDHQFMRVHNSFLINLGKVKKFVKSEGGYILMNNDKQVSISQGRRDEFMERMTSLT